MKHLGLALATLALFYSTHAAGGLNPANYKQRYTITATSTTIANEVLSQIKSNPSLYKVIKEVRSPGGVLRAIVVGVTPANAQTLQSTWGAQKITVRQEKKMKSQLHSRGGARSPQAAEAVSHLNMWGPMRILGHLPSTQSSTIGGNGTKVCVTDSGINWYHPRLKNRLLPWTIGGVTIPANYGDAYDVFNDPTAYDPLDPTKPPLDLNVYCDGLGRPCSMADSDCSTTIYSCGFDDDGHGSHVAGTIAAEAIDDGQTGVDIVGIDPTARLIAAKALGWHWIPNPLYDWNIDLPPTHFAYQPPYIYEYFGYPADFAAAIWHCMEQDAKVINMSWGGGDDSLIHAAIADASSQGIILVGAAGNEYDAESGSGPVIYPAAHPEVISVSALGLDGKISSFSSRGSRVDFIAPGSSILSTTLSSPTGVGTYAYYSGTSMAAPHVTGVVSRMLSSAPYVDRRDLVGTDIGLTRSEQGANGLINAELSCRR